MTLGLLMSKEGLVRVSCAYAPVALRRASMRQLESLSPAT